VSKAWKIVIGIVIALLVVFSISFFSVIRDQYRFEKFEEEIKVGQNCSKVRTLAEDIGYDHVVKWKDKNYDEYHFQNVMLTSVIIVTYDDACQVIELFSDR